MSSIDFFLDDVSNFVDFKFELYLEKSKLKIYSNKQWNIFCETNNFNNLAGGIYVPRGLTAYVKSNDFFILSSISHEFYGHGLFCEKSYLGKNLFNFIENGGNEFDYFYYDKENDDQFGFFKKRIYDYEGFAVWLQGLICKEFNCGSLFEMHLNKINKSYSELYLYFTEYEKKNSKNDLMRKMGFEI
jgi:hypothetical protein